MTRFRSILSATVLGAALCATPALAGNGKDQLKAVPKDFAGVLVVNLEQLNKAPLFQEIFKMMSASPEAQKGLADAREKLGMDPMAAIKTVVVAIPKGLQGEGLVLATTAAAASKIEAAAVEAGMKGKETFQGATLLKADNGEAMGLMGDQIFAGRLNLVKDALTAAKGKGGSLEKNAAVAKLVSAAPQSKDIWFAAHVAGQKQGELQHVKSARGGVDLEKGVDLHIVVTMDSAAEATKMATQAKTGLEQAKAQPQAKMMGLDAIANKMDIQAKGADIELHLPLDEADVNKLKGTIGMMMMMAGAAGGMGGGMGAPPPTAPLQMPPPAKP